MLYRKFRNSSLDTSDIGLIPGPDSSDSVYTPAGAKILAWNGVIHFCLVEGFGEMVFVVDPNAPPGDCVHPVAKNLTDFFGLVAATRSAKLIANCYQWSRAYFAEKVAAVLPTMKMRSVLRALENTYHPAKINDPYGYIQSIQQAFDYSVLPLHPDYFEWCPIRPGAPKWNVGFGSGFCDYCDPAKAGQELPLQRNFTWKGESWQVSAVYLCENGIVVDSHLEVPGEQIDAFVDKWRNAGPRLSIEEEMTRTLEDPLSGWAKGSLSVNGKPAPLRQQFFEHWNPREFNSWNSRRTLEHYGLDRDKGYRFRRECFLRRGKNPPIRTMELTLEAEPVSQPGQRFIAPDIGTSLEFQHPVTGKTHTLTVTSQTREALDPNFLSNHPCCYTRLSFSLEPHIDKELFKVVDCDPGDPHPENPNGPTAVFLTEKTPSVGHYAISSLRYTPADQITWRMVFRQKDRPDITVPLLP